MIAKVSTDSHKAIETLIIMEAYAVQMPSIVFMNCKCTWSDSLRQGLQKFTGYHTSACRGSGRQYFASDLLQQDSQNKQVFIYFQLLFLIT